VYLARSHPLADDEHGAPAPLAGLLSHLRTVYGFALVLTGSAESAADLTEGVFASTHDELWVTLGGYGLRDRLLACCVSVFAESCSWRARPESPTTDRIAPPETDLPALLRELPWNERAAIALVDQLGVTYASGAAVMGLHHAEFRTLLHRARSMLFAGYRAGAR
jgi:DNA-directed RNA polymerase specialized sigma24 family protein